MSCLAFVGSEAGIISGVERAIKEMKLKEKVRLTIKPQYAFGAEGNKTFGIPSNATVEYEVHITGLVKAKQTYDYTTADEKKTEAEKLKEKGSNYFKGNKFALAVKLYERALELVKKSSTPKDDEEELFKETRLALHLNLAAGYLKLNEATKALSQCDEVSCELHWCYETPLSCQLAFCRLFSWTRPKSRHTLGRVR